MVRVDPSGRPRDFSSAAVLAVASAAFLAFGCLLNSIGRGIENRHGGVGLNFDTVHHIENQNQTHAAAYNGTHSGPLTHMMREEIIHKRWQARREAGPTIVAGHFFSAFGWFFMVPPVASLAMLLDGGGIRSASSGIVYAVLCAAVLTVIHFASHAGTVQASNWMAHSWPGLAVEADTEDRKNAAGGITAAQAFELTYFMIHSRTLWLFALDDLFLAFALSTAAYLTFTSKQIHHGHAILGLVIVFFCILDFCFEVSRFVDWRTSSNAVIVTTITLYALLLPAWLLYLAFLLRRTSLEGGAYASSFDEAGGTTSATARIESNLEMQDAGSGAGGSAAKSYA